MSESAPVIAAGIDRILRDAVDRRLLERFDAGEYPRALWTTLEQSGYASVLAAAAAAADWQDAEPVLRAAGYHRLPLPLAETLVADWLLATAGLPARAGEATLVQADGALQLTRIRSGLRIDGLARRVPWGRHAKRVVVCGDADGEPTIALLEAPGPEAIESGQNAAREPRDNLRFAAVHAAASAGLALGANAALTYGALARAAAIAGAIESVLEQAVQYANDRVQFGRPIGKFQAIQHQLAELACESAAASAAVTAACQAAGTAGAPFHIAIAKIRAGDAAERAAAIAHQVHGAIGFTYEHTLHFGTRRLWAWRSEFGSSALWAQRVGSAMIRRGGAGLWTGMTGDKVDVGS